MAYNPNATPQNMTDHTPLLDPALTAMPTAPAPQAMPQTAPAPASVSFPHRTEHPHNHAPAPIQRDVDMSDVATPHTPFPSRVPSGPVPIAPAPPASHTPLAAPTPIYAPPTPTPALAASAQHSGTPSRIHSPHPPAQGPPAHPTPHGGPTRLYLNQHVTPHLLEAMKHLVTIEPDKPLKWLSDFLAQKSLEIEGPGEGQGRP